MDIGAVLRHLDMLFKEKELAQVEPYLLRQRQMAQAEGDRAAELTLDNELAGFYRSVSRASEAIAMADAALALVGEMGLAETMPHATTLINRATALRAAGQLPEAAADYQAALRIVETEQEKGYLLASLCNNMSQVDQTLGRHEAAIALLERALTALSALAGVDAEIATTHSNLAISLIALGRYEAARTHLAQALALFEAGDGPRDAHYGAALAAAGELAYHEGAYERAVAFFTRALPEIRASFGENDGYQTTQRNLARAQRALEEAER